MKPSPERKARKKDKTTSKEELTEPVKNRQFAFVAILLVAGVFIAPIVKPDIAAAEEEMEEECPEYNHSYKESIFDRCSWLFSSERYEEAMQCFDKVLQIDPGFADAWYYEGSILNTLGAPDEAVKYFDKALETNPDHTDAMYSKGVALFTLGDYRGAIEYFDMVLELDPENDKAWFSKGSTLFYLEEYEEAAECFDRVMELDPENEKAWYAKGATLDHLGKHGVAQKMS